MKNLNILEVNFAKLCKLTAHHHLTRDGSAAQPGPNHDQGQRCTRSKSEEQNLDGVAQEQGEKRPAGK